MALIRNLARIRQMQVIDPSSANDPSKKPTTTNYGQLIQEAFQDVQKQLSNVSGQTNAHLSATQNSAPPQVNALHVDGGNGFYHAYITDNNQNLYRGVEYTAEYSTTPDFQDFHVEHLGPARDKRINLGVPGPLYWRAYSGYGPASPPSSPVYHGGAQPVGVSGGGTAAPALRSGQGSGTNPPTQGAGGYGQLPWRGANPPKRA